MVRNYTVTGHWSYTSNSGKYLWDNIWELRRIAQGLEPNEPERLASVTVNHASFEGSSLLVAEGIKELRKFSLTNFLAAEAISLMRLMAGGGSQEYYRVSGVNLKWPSIVWACLLKVALLVGLILAVRRRVLSSEMLVLLAVCAYFVAMYGFLGQARFRIPMEPLLTSITVWGIKS